MFFLCFRAHGLLLNELYWLRPDFGELYLYTALGSTLPFDGWTETDNRLMATVLFNFTSSFDFYFFLPYGRKYKIFGGSLFVSSRFKRTHNLTHTLAESWSGHTLHSRLLMTHGYMRNDGHIQCRQRFLCYFNLDFIMHDSLVFRVCLCVSVFEVRTHAMTGIDEYVFLLFFNFFCFVLVDNETV